MKRSLRSRADSIPTDRLTALINFLKTNNGARVVLAAHRDNLEYKKRRYENLLTEAERDVSRERELIGLKMPELKRTSKVQGEQDNWLIFESVSRKFIEAQERASIFDAILQRACHRMRALDAELDGQRLSHNLLAALENLYLFRMQPHVVGTVVDVVGAFLKNPALIRSRFLNFMVVGASGTGKTTLASLMARCLACAGMFVEDRVVDAGRAELVAEYEGQTTARTRHFLLSNLDRGVIFVDEAYSITQWSDGKPEAYGAEAVSAMVEFMTRYKGLYCIITAGYEKEMQRYFLATNPGLARRFPYRFALHNMDALQLVHVFKRTLVTEQGKVLPAQAADSGAFLESDAYFTREAWAYLQSLVALSTSGCARMEPEEYDRATNRTYSNTPRFVPHFPHLYTLFENQAGSMTNLAEECVTVLMSQLPFQGSHRSLRGDSLVVEFPRNQPLAVMQQVVRQRVLNSALSSAPVYFSELQVVEQMIH